MIDKVISGEERQFERDGNTVKIPFGASGKLLLGKALAPDYDATGTYDVDDFCNYEGLCYKCTVAIAEPEAFNVDHWELAPLVDAMKNAAYTDAEKAAFASFLSMDTELSDCETVQDVAITKLEQLLGETIS